MTPGDAKKNEIFVPRDARIDAVASVGEPDFEMFRLGMVSLLRDLAKFARDNRFARAAAALSGAARAGRPALEDAPLVVEVANLLRLGETDSVERAARMVAATTTGHSVAAVAKRLARKYRARRQAQNAGD